MANTSIDAQAEQGIFKIPRLQVQVNKFNNSIISNLRNNEPQDPIANGIHDWREPNLMLFTRDMTQDILDMNPVVVFTRILPNTRNSKKSNGKKVNREVIPGNSANNGLQFHGGNSATNRQGTSIAEVTNFIPITKTNILGYNDVLFSKFVLPVNRFVNDNVNGAQFSGPQSAIYVPQWHDSIAYTQFKRNRNYYMKFRVMLAVQNPNWKANNHLNKWLFGEGQTIIVEPRLQTFNPDGSGALEYFISWKAKVVN